MMKTFAICFVALFAVASARSVIDNIGNEPDFINKLEQFDDKIVGGRETTIEKHPHQISLRFIFQHICGGSILTTTRALTAGHCVDPKYPVVFYQIQAGSSERTGDDKAQVRRLIGFVRHALFDTPKFSNDVAILSWEKPLTFGANVRPIKLPSANATVPYGEKAVASGWGLVKHEREPSDILKEVVMPLVSTEVCNRAYENKVLPTMVCAGGEAGRGGCNGDSGGPLVHKNTLIGIASWTRPCAHEGFPTVFARVAYFIDWIEENIKL